MLPNFKLLGKKLGKRLPLVKPALAACDGAELMAKLKRNGAVQISLDGEVVELTSEELEVRLTPSQVGPRRASRAWWWCSTPS